MARKIDPAIRVITAAEKLEDVHRHKTLLTRFYRLSPPMQEGVLRLMQAMIDGRAPQVEEAPRRVGDDMTPELSMVLEEIRKILRE